MIKFFYNLSPNPMKVALFLEETGVPYEPVPVDTRRGEQFRPDYLAVNPNAKVPAIVDGDATVFDSNAILLYLAEKTGQFLPESTPAARGEMLSWLMFVATGIGPFSGQAVHFRHFAPEKVPYALTRYMFEAERHYGILDRRLAERRYILGPSYTIVDMAAWGWARMVPFIMGDDAWGRFPNVRRLHDEIAARPAAARVAALREKHAFKAEMDDEARRNMFRHLAEAADRAA
ncbi:MAG: glutathione S-transferase family protein [Microvirga sp.]